MSLLLAGMAISAVGSIFSGVSSHISAQQAATDMRAEGEIVFRESMRTATIIEEEGRKFAAGQSLQYIGSGVQLTGSALITIAQTKKYAATEAQAVRDKGVAGKGLMDRTAARKENEGRASLISGIFGGVSGFASLMGTSKAKTGTSKVKTGIVAGKTD